MAGYQEIDISTGLPITLEQILIESKDVIRSCVAEMIRLIETDEETQTDEGRTNTLLRVSARITFELRRIKNAIDFEKSNPKTQKGNLANV